MTNCFVHGVDSTGQRVDMVNNAHAIFLNGVVADKLKVVFLIPVIEFIFRVHNPSCILCWSSKSVHTYIL